MHYTARERKARLKELNMECFNLNNIPENAKLLRTEKNKKIQWLPGLGVKGEYFHHQDTGTIERR